MQLNIFIFSLSVVFLNVNVFKKYILKNLNIFYNKKKTNTRFVVGAFYYLCNY